MLSADEKTHRKLARPHPTLTPAAGQPDRYEFEYVRNGTLAYLAALDVGSGQVFGRIGATTGIIPFKQLVDLVMQRPPYATWNAFSGSSMVARAIIRAQRPLGCSEPIRTLSSCIYQRMPVG